MKILISGLGSIGQRHLKNLQSFGVSNLITVDSNPQEKADYTDLEKALKNESSVKAAFICSPTHLHIPQATICAQHKINLFIEKPLSYNFVDVKKLISIVNKYKLITMMGFNYRFHPGFITMKKLLENKIIGKIHLVRLYGGHYLPDWHKHEDYRLNYAAQKKMGGGVILTSVIHDFDYLRFLFGEINIISSYSTKLSQLDIDVEDAVSVLMTSENNVHITLSSNFLERVKKHQIEITGSLGQIEWTYNQNKVRYYTPKSGWQEMRYQFQTNDMYLAELKYFLNCIGKKIPASPDIHDGLKALKLALEAKTLH